MMLRRFLIITMLFLTLPAFTEEFVAGKDYQLVSGTLAKPASNSKVLVTEFFSYGCPWCYRIEPKLLQWEKKQAKVTQFSRVPVVFNKDWLIYAKAYYTAQLLGLEAKLSPLLFAAVQEKEHSLNTNKAMIDFFTAQGVDKATAESAFENSTTIDMQVNTGMGLMSNYHIEGVPSFIINNQYKTNLEMAKTEERLWQILDYLVAKERARNNFRN
jgi:protein dithiol oxidoreductase (disulfide-forming)